MGFERVDQVIPSLASRDAIGHHSLLLRDLLREMGAQSEIFYRSASADVLGEGRPLSALDSVPRQGRALLYQLSIGSPAASVFAGRPEPKFVDYHNMSPFELIGPWEPLVGEELRLGRRQIDELAPVVSGALAVSAFNKAELDGAGYHATRVSPLLFDAAITSEEPDPDVLRRLAEDRAHGGADLLFVGKVAPHKAQHDLVKALVALRALYDPRARLRLVGGTVGTRYPAAVRRFAEELGVAGAVDFAGSVTPAALAAYYRSCDVFVCLSDHEGFGVPLVEAMAHEVPVIAYAAAAVPETVGGGGLVLPDKAPVTVATAVHRVCTDDALRRALSAAALARATELSLEQARPRMRRQLSELFGLSP